MRHLLFLVCLNLGCATLPEPVATERPVAVTPPTAEGACAKNPSGYARMTRLTDSPVTLKVGQTVDLRWAVIAMCAPIVIRGMQLRVIEGGVPYPQPTQRLPERIVSTKEPVIVGLTFGTQLTVNGGQLEIDGDPLWTDSEGVQTFTFAERSESTVIIINVIRPPTATDL